MVPDPEPASLIDILAGWSATVSLLSLRSGSSLILAQPCSFLQQT